MSSQPEIEVVDAEFEDEYETEYEPQILVLVDHGFARVEYLGDCSILVVDLDEVRVRGLDGVPPEADRWLTDFGELEGVVDDALLEYERRNAEPVPEFDLGGEG